MTRAAAETALADALEREWLGQSGGRRPLAITPAVREAVELAAAGALGVAAALRHDAPSPDALIDRVRDRLPERIDPWSLRLLRRLGDECDELPPALPPRPIARPAAEPAAKAPRPSVPPPAPKRGRPTGAAVWAAAGALAGALVASRRR